MKRASLIRKEHLENNLALKSKKRKKPLAVLFKAAPTRKFVQVDRLDKLSVSIGGFG
jgi:hypothetical protein